MIMTSTYKKHITIIFAFILLLSSNIKAQSDSLSHYLTVAADNNTGLKADFLLYKASMEKLPQVGTLPDLQLDMGFYIQPMDVIDGRQVADFTLMQMFPWFGTKKAAQTEAQHQANVAYEQFRESRDNLFLEVYTQWYKLCSLQQKLKNIDEQQTYLNHLQELAVLKYSSSSPNSSGADNMSSTLRIKLETVELDNSRESIISEIKSEKAKFNSLLNRPSGIQVIIPDTIIKVNFSLDILSALEDISAQSPTLGMIKEESLSFAAKAKADKKMSMPMIGVGVQYSLLNKRLPTVIPVSDMNGMDMIMPMISLSIPIYRNKYKAQQRESKLMQQAGTERYNQVFNSIKSELISINHQLDDALRTITLLEKQTELATSTHSLILREYSTGRSNLTDVIEVQRQLLDYKLRKSDAIATYNTMAASAQRLSSFNDKINYNKQ